MNKFVQKTVGKKALGRCAHGAPGARRCQFRNAIGPHSEIRDCVGQVPGTGRDLAVRPRHGLPQPAHLRGNSRDCCNLQIETLHPAVGHRSGTARHAYLAREVMGKVFFARVGQFDRDAG